MSNALGELLEFNKKFVEERMYEEYRTSKYPTKKIAVLSCMDTRLTSLLPAALNFKNGDIKIIKNAGAIVTNPFDSVIRSLLIAVYKLGVQEILVIGHDDCGNQNIDTKDFLEKMRKRGVDSRMIEKINYNGFDLEEWLRGFECAEASAIATAKMIQNHPLLPDDVKVHAFMMNPVTGELTEELLKLTEISN